MSRKTVRGGDLTLNDAALLSCYIEQRDESAFELLVQRHGQMVRRACRTILSDFHAAEDATQTTFILLAEKAASLKDPSRLSNWLYGVAQRVSQNARRTNGRRRARETWLAQEPPRLVPDPTTTAIQAELRHLLLNAAEGLGPGQRDVVRAYIEAWGDNEAAAQQSGLSLSAFRGRLFRVLQKLSEFSQLRESYGRHYYSASILYHNGFIGHLLHFPRPDEYGPTTRSFGDPLFRFVWSSGRLSPRAGEEPDFSHHPTSIAPGALTRPRLPPWQPPSTTDPRR